jgi:hypothetical protein
MNKRIIICDIDGVVCDSSARLAKYSDYEALERGDYNAFRVSMHAYNSASVHEDIPLPDGIQILRGLQHAYDSEHGVLTKFLTSRGNESRRNTFEWLRTHVDESLIDENLIMRPEYLESEPGVFWREGEPRFCHIEYKRGESERLRQFGNIVVALDDHLPLCEMYQSIGIPALHVKLPGVDCISRSGMYSAQQVPALN